MSFWKLSCENKDKSEVNAAITPPQIIIHTSKMKIKLDYALTPCFMMSLAWLATSLTIFKAAVQKKNTEYRELEYLN